jgi:hypothetical protein
MRVLVLWLCTAAVALAAVLDGRVVEDHTGNPLASVELKVYKFGQRTLAAHLETDTSGHFHAESLTAGDYRIEATKANYIGATLRMSGVAGGLLLRLVRCGVISGQVVDGQGQAILGATVYAMPKPVAGGPLRPFGQLNAGNFARADERGAYRLHGLPPGEYAVAVAYGASTAMFGSTGGAEVRPGLGSGVQLYPTNQRPQYFAVTGGEQYRNIDFSVLPTSLYNVSGKVTLPDPKSRFWLALIAADQPSLAQAVASTEPDGSFKFEGVPSGPYTLTASGPTRGYGGKAVLAPEPYFGRTQVSVGADVSGIAVAVQRARPVSLVLRPGGAGCPSTTQITLTALEDFAAMIDRSGEINSEKPQAIADLAPSRYLVVAKSLGESCYLASDTVVDLVAGAGDATVTVPLAAAGAIHGKLSGAANPAEFAVALVTADPDSSAPVQVVFPAADGRFAFGGLRPGRYRIVAQPAGEVSKARWVTDPARMIEMQIPAGAPTEMELPAPKRSRQ